jgi:cytochrome c2
LQHHGCGACHQVPGVNGATGMVGPSLDHIASRAVLAGELANTPANLIRWIRVPQEIEPGTSMPNLNVDQRDALDMTAYLYTLR